MQKIIKVAKQITIVLSCALVGVQLITAVIELVPHMTYVIA